MTQWIQSSNVKQDGTPVTRAIKIPEMSEEIWFTTNAYAEVSQTVGDLLANQLESISKVSEPSSPGEYYGSAGANTTVELVLADKSFNDLSVTGTADIAEADAERLLSEWSSDKYLAGDGSNETTEFTNLIQDAEADADIQRVRVESGTYTLGSQLAPSTSGSRLVLEAVGDVELDVSGVTSNPCIDLSSASNLELRGRWTITGATGAGIQWSMLAAPGLRFDTLEFDTGQGALDLTNQSDVAGDRLVVSGQRDTDIGAAACLHASESTDVRIGHVTGSDSDRGIEIEDGSTNITVDSFELTNIDNSGASNPSTQFVLDVHNHTGEGAVENITYGSGILDSCARGPTALGVDSERHVSNISFEKVVMVDCAVGAQFAGGVYVGELIGEFPNTTPSNACAIDGGNVTLSSLEVRDPPTVTHVEFGQKDSVSHGAHRIQSARVNSGSQTTGHGISFNSGANVKHLVVTDWDEEGKPNYNGIRIQDNGLIGDNTPRYAGEFYSCDFIAGSGSQLTQSSTGNDTILMVGGNANQCDFSDAVLRDVEGLSVSNLPAGVPLNDIEALPNVSSAGFQAVNSGTPVNRVVTISDETNGQTGAFLLAEGSVTEIADPSSNFGTATGSGNNHDVIWDSANSQHVVENASGGSVTYTVSYGSL